MSISGEYLVGCLHCRGEVEIIAVALALDKMRVTYRCVFCKRKYAVEEIERDATGSLKGMQQGGKTRE